MRSDVKLYTVAALFIISASCNAQSKKNLDSRSTLKKWGITYCISEIQKGSKLDTLASNGLAAYFELGSHNQQAYDEVKKFIQNYIQTSTYNSKYNNDLSLMKCIDLATNSSYEKKIIYCDKWIIKN